VLSIHSKCGKGTVLVSSISVSKYNRKTGIMVLPYPIRSRSMLWGVFNK